MNQVKFRNHFGSRPCCNTAFHFADERKLLLHVSSQRKWLASDVLAVLWSVLLSSMHSAFSSSHSHTNRRGVGSSQSQMKWSSHVRKVKLSVAYQLWWIRHAASTLALSRRGPATRALQVRPWRWSAPRVGMTAPSSLPTQRILDASTMQPKQPSTAWQPIPTWPGIHRPQRALKGRRRKLVLLVLILQLREPFAWPRAAPLYWRWQECRFEPPTQLVLFCSLTCLLVAFWLGFFVQAKNTPCPLTASLWERVVSFEWFTHTVM